MFSTLLLSLRHQLQYRVLVGVSGIRFQQFLPSGKGSGSIFLTLPLYDAEIEKAIGLLRVVGQRLVELRDRGVCVAGVP